MTNHSNRPRWEDIYPEEVDYKARDGFPTGFERDLAMVRKQIRMMEAKLCSLFSQLGISSGSDLVDIHIPRLRQFSDPYLLLPRPSGSERPVES